MTLAVVVPAYNGSELLRQFLPSVAQSARLAGASQIIVVDDASTDGSAAAAREAAPDVEVLPRAANGGFGAAVNGGVRAARADLVAVCMTDMELAPECLTAACEACAPEDVFAAGFHLKTSEGSGNAGVTALPFRRGLFHTEFPGGGQPELFQADRTDIAFAVGGAMVVKKERFDALGGFDALYAPYFWEDIDLCWRAWMRGWRCVNEPRAIAWHRHPHQTVNSTSQAERRQAIVWRNRIAFLIKNIHDRHMLREHRLWMLLMIAKAAVRGDRTLAQAAKEARKLAGTRPNPAPGRWSERELAHLLATPRACREYKKA